MLLKPNQALGLSLVLHELATNAVKYGALSTDQGQVHVTWAAEAEAGGRPQMRMRWAESGGPVVEIPQKSGFGTQLIVRICEYDLEGHASLTYRPEGLLCEFTIPMG
jgi:two-component sensor histidine kinase